MKNMCRKKGDEVVSKSNNLCEKPSGGLMLQIQKILNVVPCLHNKLINICKLEEYGVNSS